MAIVRYGAARDPSASARHLPAMFAGVAALVVEDGTARYWWIRTSEEHEEQDHATVAVPVTSEGVPVPLPDSVARVVHAPTPTDDPLELPVLDRFPEDERARRAAVRPGLTGLWQVSGRSETDLDALWAIDARYVRTWSLLGDLRILVRTPWAVVSRRGAY